MLSNKGLNSQQVEESRQKYGSNQLASKAKKSVMAMFLESFKDIWILVLCAALGVKVLFMIIGYFVPALAAGNEWVELVSIIAAIILSTGFSTYSEYKNTSRSEALQEEYNKTYAKVMRNGKIENILTSEIVKDDVILLQAGDKIPVDGILITGKLKVSQAALNGESRDENKVFTETMDEAESTDYASQHKVFMGSVCTAGEAYMLATVVGDATELGKINKSLTDEGEERQDTSSLKLEVVAKQIGKLGVSAATIASVLQVVLTLVRANEPITAVFVTVNIISAIMLMASIIIMAVPEGLPMMNSLVQSMNTESLYKKNILVSHKAAFSDSAYMDLLFSDKTGTISQGVLSLVEFITGNGKVVPHLKSKNFIEAITLNNSAKVSAEGPIGSNNMDRALLKYALDNGYNPDTRDESKVADRIDFTSDTKCAIVKLNDGTSYWKGATEVIINDLTHYIDEDGNEKPFTAEDKKALEVAMHEQAKRTMKLLTVAQLEGDKKILYGVLCLRDNVRKDAAETVHILDKAGIQTVMVTGDMEETAVAIAKEANILTNPETDIVLTHEQLESMSDEELKEKLPNLRVVSRAKPLDKKRLVSIAQSMDRVVGMTGDGKHLCPVLA